jgi:hypothetical protein
MTEGFAGWLPDELPASKHLRRTLAEVALPPSAAERAAAREEAERTSARDTGSGADEAGFIARMNAHPPRDPLADAAAEPFRDREAAVRRRAAIAALRPLGLADVITGGQSGCVLDANMGILEPVEDQSARAANAAADRRYEFERSQREADERNRIVARSKMELEERRRALGLDSPRVSYRPRIPALSGTGMSGPAARLAVPRELPGQGCAG